MGVPGGSLLSLRLRRGTELRVTAEGVWIGERLVALAAIQDARQVSPDPETVALRVAGAGLVDFQPERAGDAGLALEAIYRLRPDLRPPGFESRELPSGFPVSPPPPGPSDASGGYAAPLPQYGQIPPGTFAPHAPGYPPAPSGYAPPPYTQPPYAPPYTAARQAGPEHAAWSASHGELTPFPRTYGGLLGAILQLYNRHFGKLALAAICVALLPTLANGVAQLALLHALGFDPLAGTTGLASASCQDPTTCNPFSVFHPRQGSTLMLDAALGAGALMVSWLLAAWQLAALAVASRQAVLGRPIGVGASVAAGLRRFFPTLIAWVLVQGLIVVLFAPAVALYAYLIASLFPSGALTASAAASTSSTVALSALLGCFALMGGVVGLVFFSTRLGLAPYAAAVERVGPLHALGRSWRLTRGSFWRTLGIWLTIAVATGIPSYIGGQFGSLSAPLAYLALLPLIQVFTAPLMALAWVTLLYDLRLRREGYAAVTTQADESGAQRAAPGKAE